MAKGDDEAQEEYAKFWAEFGQGAEGRPGIEDFSKNKEAHRQAVALQEHPVGDGDEKVVSLEQYVESHEVEGQEHRSTT